MKKIKLAKGQFTLVDDQDFKLLNQFKWYLDKTGYASRTKYVCRINNKKRNKKIFMHQIIIGTNKGMSTDHVNGNKLDNRRKNLRECTQQQNTFNRINNKNNTSGYKGVFYMKSSSRIKRWMAQLMFNRKSIFIGYFLTKQEAALAYNKKAKELFGEFVRLNTI